MKKLSVLITFVIVLASCTKEEQSFCVNAMVRWEGDPNADGLGWHLIVDSLRSISYIPKNLPDSFKIDNLPVNVCLYQTNDKFHCECAGPLNKYQISSIRKL